MLEELALSWAPRAITKAVASELRQQQHDCFLSIERFDWQRRQTFITTFVAIDGSTTVVIATTAIAAAIVTAAIIGACLG